MIKTLTLILLTLIGVFTYPIFTLGCVLIHYNHPVIGIVIIIYSLSKDKNEDVID